MVRACDDLCDFWKQQEVKIVFRGGSWELVMFCAVLMMSTTEQLLYYVRMPWIRMLSMVVW